MLSGKDMTHRANWRPRKFLERLSKTYGLLRSVQCHFLLVGREDAWGAMTNGVWGCREQEGGKGARPPTAASSEPPPPALRAWEGVRVARGLREWPLPCRVEMPTSGSH